MSFAFANKILLFSDGASKGNPGPGGYGVVLVFPEGKVKEYGGAGSRVTNNQMELLGVIEGLKKLSSVQGDVAVLSDSSYVLHGITSWVHGWRRRGWLNASGSPVANKSYWQQLYDLVLGRKEKGELSWHYTPGHAGIPGNERVDVIASDLAQKKHVDFYTGPLIGYEYAVYDLPDDTSIPPMKKKSESARKKQAFSYLSLVNGELEKHTTWAECEARVKGRAGARFKKAMSADDEIKIMRDWGLQ